MSRELKRRLAKLEAAAVIEAQRRASASLRGLTLEQLEDKIVALAERWVGEDPASPVVAEVRRALAAGDRREAMSILKRVFATRGTENALAKIEPEPLDGEVEQMKYKCAICGIEVDAGTEWGDTVEEALKRTGHPAPRGAVVTPVCEDCALEELSEDGVIEDRVIERPS